MKMSEITSRFYLIDIEGTPAYVGVTTRPIRLRFKEHIHGKNLPKNASISEIEILTHNFSWDINVVKHNAREVSIREALLIKQYDTQDSPYQKAIGGGNVWTEIKHFVQLNQSSSFWQSLPDDMVIKTIEQIRNKKSKLRSRVDLTNNGNRLKMFINDTNINRKLRGTISQTKTTQRLDKTIHQTKIGKRVLSIVDNTKTGRRIEHTVTNTKISRRLEVVVGHTKEEAESWANSHQEVIGVKE